MANKDAKTLLWEERKVAALKAALPKQGPYIEQRNEILALLIEAKRFSLLTEVPVNAYVLQLTPRLLGSSSTIELLVNFKTNALQVAVRISKDGGGESRFYNLTDSGHAVDLDNLDNLNGLSLDEEEWKYKDVGINTALRELRRLVDRKIDQHQEHRRKIRIRLYIWAAAISLVAIGILCVRWWFFEPQEVANRARIAYDSGNHQLDSAGYPVDTHALASVPSNDMRSIPTYGGDDKVLEHPRTISVSYNSSYEWCSSIDVDIPSDSALAVAVEEESLFARDRYVATYVDRKLTICLVEGFVKNEASKTVVANLAIQVKPQRITN